MTKILVIEDDPVIRGNLIDLLELENYMVSHAEDGLSGVQLARESLPDLIICDIMMPNLDGYGVLTALRTQPATAMIPFIFLTAKADKADRRAGMGLGADDYLTKPFTSDEVLSAIDARFKRRTVLTEQYERKLDELRDSISFAMPHELRTPLTGILGVSTILADNADSFDAGQIREMATIMSSSALRLNRLIENYLLFAELEIIGTSPENVEVLRAMGPGGALKTIVSDYAHQTAKQAGRESDLTLDLQGIAVRMDVSHLKKIVEELLDNAFKFSRPGMAVLISGQADHQRVVLSVTDHGRGMTAEQIAQVGAYIQFERKLHEQQGSGLGLAIVKLLAKLYSGELRIESTPNVQTTVTVILPV